MRAPSDAAVAAVRRYYEGNTPLFRALGRGRAARATHRALWGGAPTSLAAALRRVDDLLLDEVRRFADGRADARLLLADLGCGIGGTLALAADRLPAAHLAGVTISRAQARLARAALPPRCVVVEADFLHLPLAGRLDFAWAVEAFAHAPDVARCYAEAAAALRPGGRLLVIDDVLAAPTAGRGAHWLAAFRAGWAAYGLSSVETTLRHAAAAGLQLLAERDLTPELRTRALPDALAAALLAPLSLARGHPFAQSLAGSLALQQCLARGLVRYRLLLFERAARHQRPVETPAHDRT